MARIVADQLSPRGMGTTADKAAAGNDPRITGAVQQSGLGAEVRSTPLTGLSTADSSTVTAGDTVLQGLGKLQAQSQNKVDKVVGKGLSTEDYTTAEKSKLAGLESSKWKGLFVSLSALQAGVPSPSAGDYGDVDLGIGEPVTRYLWDVSDSEWVPQAGESAPVTSSQVKSLYEANPDTNAFTDAEKSKLSGVATGATANTGTVTSVGVSVPTGLSVAGSPITTSGTLNITYSAGYSIPTSTKQSQWDTAYSWGNHASAGYAPTNSPGLTGTPTAPTPAAGTNNTQIATTAYVKSQGYQTVAGLGTAATKDIQTSGQDATAGRVLTVGAFGLGKLTAGGRAFDFNDIDYRPGFIDFISNTSTNPPPTGTGGAGIRLAYRQQDGTNKYVSDFVITNNDGPSIEAYLKSMGAGSNGTWYRVYHSGNLVAATTSVNGLMAAADKAKLNGIATGATANTGTVTSVGLSTPTGLTVSGSPITTSGTLTISYAAGYALPTTAKQSQWDTAYGWGNHASAGYAPATRTITSGTGLTGGGDLTANRTLSVSYGTTAGTAAQGNDSRINNGQTAYGWGNHASAGYVPSARTVSAGTGLTGGGDLTTNRSFAVSYGTAAGTAAQGNDSRINNGQTAYSWGNHASAGYAPTASPTFTGTVTMPGTTGQDNALTRFMLRDTGYGYYDATSSTTLNYVNGSVQRWAPTGSVALTITNWAPTNNLSELLIEGINLGSATIDWGSINWVLADGSTSQTFADTEVELQASGTDWIMLWTRDSGTTVYGKVMR